MITSTSSPGFSGSEAWLVTGSQHLYGPGPLQQVAENAASVALELNKEAGLPVRVVQKDIATSPEAVTRLLREAENTDECIGVIAWMHTFSPAKMWIDGLLHFSKPVLHFHTQFNRDLPWGEIDMDFMNLNQSAHGGREFGYMMTRLGLDRKVVVGHRSDPEVRRQIDVWSRAAAAVADQRQLNVVRFGDNMRDVAVTEGDKVEAQIKFGYRVHGFGLGDLVEHLHAVSETDVHSLCDEYDQLYEMAADLGKSGSRRKELQESARIELGLRSFLQEKGSFAFTDTFENLHGLSQLPGIAVQRLMNDGYGFGAEGDWKTAALVRAFKVMSAGNPGGVSFMEDYTYDFGEPDSTVLGAHMLEICPSISSERPRCEIHPLSIGGKNDPVRLVFTADPGTAVNASIIDLGHRFRLIVNTVESLVPPQKLPRLPVARALWKPQPSLAISAASWIHAGGAHHTAYSPALGLDHVRDFCEMLGIECVIIDENSTVESVKASLRSWRSDS